MYLRKEKTRDFRLAKVRLEKVCGIQKENSFTRGKEGKRETESRRPDLVEVSQES